MSTIFNQKFVFFVYLKIIVLRRKYISQVDQYQLSRNHYHSTTHTHTQRTGETRREKRREEKGEKKKKALSMLFSSVEQKSKRIVKQLVVVFFT